LLIWFGAIVLHMAKRGRFKVEHGDPPRANARQSGCPCVYRAGIFGL
jgi:hypothetical protein